MGKAGNDPEQVDRAVREAGVRLLKAMFLAQTRGQLDLVTDEAARAHSLKLTMTAAQAHGLARRLEESGPPRGLLMRGLFRLRQVLG